jgi:hypothetical protein
MAWLAETLGVDCRHCHVPHPTEPDKEDYPVMTDNKRIANWMYHTFIQGLRPVDGERTMCTSCHFDRATKKPLMAVLGEPRDGYAAELWMQEVMTAQFVEANGARLKCKTCHVAMSPESPGWVKDVVRYLSYTGSVERRDSAAGDTGD